MQLEGSKDFADIPPPPSRPWGWGQGQNSTFSEHGHVAYQIKFCPQMPPTLGVGSIGQISTFSEHDHVAYQIKGNHKW